MSIEFLSKRLRRRGFRETDKGWTSAVGLVPIGPCISVWSFRAYDCSFGVRRRRAWRTRGYRTKDTRGIRKRRYPIYRGERWRTRRAPSKAAKAEAVRNRRCFLRNEPNLLSSSDHSHARAIAKRRSCRRRQVSTE